MTSEIDNYLDFLKEMEQGALDTLQGLPPEAVNWRPLPDTRAPGADDHITNSLAVVAAHLAGSVRYWIGEVAGGRPEHRDRAAEFRVQAGDAAELTALVSGAADYARSVLARLPPEHLDETVERNGKPVGRRHAVVHALTHAFIHVGHMQMTRQLWDASPK